jgi:hypothetical protein
LAPFEDLVHFLDVVVSCESHLDEPDVGAGFGEDCRMWINNGKQIIGEVPLDEGEGTSANGPMSEQEYMVDMAIVFVLGLRLHQQYLQ